MSTDHLLFAFWFDDEDWLWIRHVCNGEVKLWHPDDRWSVSPDGGVTPSFDCGDCGAHTILRASDRWRNCLLCGALHGGQTWQDCPNPGPTIDLAGAENVMRARRQPDAVEDREI